MSAITARAIEKMAAYYAAHSNVRLHDINHFMKVWGFARTIGLGEGLDAATQETLELAAIIHDIACPVCREKYGQADGKHQETEGEPLAREFYADFGLPPAQVDRIAYIVAHHHTYTGVDGLDYQIMLEADFLVNADEEPVSPAGIASFRQNVYRTKTGLTLLDSLYPTAD